MGLSSPELRRAQKSAPPTNHRSTEDILRFHAQLRPAFAHRSRANYRNPTSVEKGPHRSKGRHHQFSGGVLLAGAEASAKSAPPTNRRSTEDILRFHAQLRPTFAHRSRANYRNPNSGQHSLTGAEQITGTPPPLRRALTGAKLRASSIPDAGSLFLI